MVKAPKIFFTDPGILCHLVGLKDAEFARNGPLSGAIFESAVVSEIHASYLHRGVEPELYFWRTAVGSEVDLIAKDRGKLIPIEIKTSCTPNPRMTGGIESFRNDFKRDADDGWVIYPGERLIPLVPGNIGFWGDAPESGCNSEFDAHCLQKSPKA